MTLKVVRNESFSFIVFRRNLLNNGGLRPVFNNLKIFEEHRIINAAKQRISNVQYATIGDHYK